MQRSEATRKSPFELVIGRQPSTPNALAASYERSSPTAYNTMKEWHEQADLSWASLDKAAKKMKKKVHKGLIQRYESPFLVIGRVEKVFSTRMAFGGNTHDVGSFREEADKTIALHQWKNPTSTISDQKIANLKARKVENEVVRVMIPKCMSWLDAYDEPICDIKDKVDNPSPQSTPQVLSSFEVYTPPVTYLEEVDETIGILMEVIFDEKKLVKYLKTFSLERSGGRLTS
ncbi:hypothetical protein Tco_0749260 [Tanacetum coccineum]|uniref:Uncharacterized protein n=1 Tax=Tanacetum coccineum TaxID=301880 RepID=A0ABQ4YXW2_9ASTR